MAMGNFDDDAAPCDSGVVQRYHEEERPFIHASPTEEPPQYMEIGVKSTQPPSPDTPGVKSVPTHYVEPYFRVTTPTEFTDSVEQTSPQAWPEGSEAMGLSPPAAHSTRTDPGYLTLKTCCNCWCHTGVFYATSPANYESFSRLSADRPLSLVTTKRRSSISHLEVGPTQFEHLC